MTDGRTAVSAGNMFHGKGSTTSFDDVTHDVKVKVILKHRLVSRGRCQWSLIGGVN